MGAVASTDSRGRRPIRSVVAWADNRRSLICGLSASFARISYMPLQIVFQQIPPVSEFGPTTRTLVEKGVLIQRELITVGTFETQARERGIGLDRSLLEAWDRDGVLSPLAFCTGSWTTWRTTDPYPIDGIIFREEVQFRPWDEYAFQQHGHPVVSALYSEWQLLYVALAREGETLEVPLDTFKLGSDAVATFAANHQPFIDGHLAYREGLHLQWLATIRLLLRLQARYWPFVHGRSVILWDDQNQVDALDIEYDAVDAEQLRAELRLDPEVLEGSYRWLAERARSLDPLPQLYDIRRFEARRERERDAWARPQRTRLLRRGRGFASRLSGANRRASARCGSDSRPRPAAAPARAPPRPTRRGAPLPRALPTSSAHGRRGGNRGYPH